MFVGRGNAPPLILPSSRASYMAVSVLHTHIQWHSHRQIKDKHTHTHTHTLHTCAHLPPGKTANCLISQGAFLLLMKISLLPCLCLRVVQSVTVKEDMVFVQYLMDMKAWARRCIYKPLSVRRVMKQSGLAIWENYISRGCYERGVTAWCAPPLLGEYHAASKI